MVDKIIFTVTPIFQFLPAERPLLKRGCIRLLSVPISQIALFVSRIQDTQITPLLMIIVVFIGLDSVAYISGYFKNGQDLILYHIHREY